MNRACFTDTLQLLTLTPTNRSKWNGLCFDLLGQDQQLYITFVKQDLLNSDVGCRLVTNFLTPEDGLKSYRAPNVPDCCHLLSSRGFYTAASPHT